MMIFLEIKEWLKSFYGKHGTLAKGLIKFIYALVAVIMLNENIGYMERLTSVFVPPIVALVCAFLPFGAISFILAMIMVAHIYTVSLEIAIITAIFLLIVALLYYGFSPRDSYWVVLTPIAFILKVPFAVPLLAGLSGSIVTAIPVSCGVAIYYIIMYVKQNAGVLTNDASVDITQRFILVIRALVSNQAMIVMIAVCLVGIIAVYLIRTMPTDYAWGLAIVIGSVLQLIAVFVGDYLFDVTIPIGELLAGAFVSMAIAAVFHFFAFAVDYTRTEYTQFEDDDYVYYVKAVPKVVVSRPDVRVQRINNPERNRRTR